MSVKLTHQTFSFQKKSWKIQYKASRTLRLSTLSTSPTCQPRLQMKVAVNSLSIARFGCILQCCLGEAVTDGEPRMTCALCSVPYPTTQLKVASRLPQRNIIFLACLLIKEVITAEDAVRVYNGFKKTQKRCCKKHYLEAVCASIFQFLAWNV